MGFPQPHPHFMPMHKVRMPQIRRWLIAACLVASLPLVARATELVADMRRDRLAEATFQRGLELASQGRVDEAAAAFRTVIAMVPQAEPVYVSLAQLEVSRGQLNEAIAVYRRLLATYPFTYHATLRHGIGVVELRAGYLEDARSDLLEAVTLDPMDWGAYYFLGHVYQRLGQTVEARAAWERVVAIRPDFHAADEQLQKLDSPRP